MNQHTPLPADVRIAQEVVEQLKASGIDSDDPDFATLIESECDLQERLRRMMRAARWSAKQAEALKDMVDEMRERQKRMEAKAERIKAAVLWTMQETGLSKLEAPDMAVTIAKGKPPLVVTADPAALPDEFVKIVREPSKTKLREALEAGVVIDGVSFGNAAAYLTTRYK